MAEFVDMTSAEEVVRFTDIYRQRYRQLVESEAERVAKELKETIDASWTLERHEVAANSGSRWLELAKAKPLLHLGNYYHVMLAMWDPDCQRYRRCSGAALAQWTEGGWDYHLRTHKCDLLVWI